MDGEPSCSGYVRHPPMEKIIRAFTSRDAQS